ncbi:MAG: tetratricopeptide repeat protein [Deltaproteobacteria bacterium]|nr:tetratricopeptide repeat protein [Deltaproteobacteria bacterium]
MASYALDYFLNQNLWGHLEGLNPFGFHFSNLVYHVITVLLVFLVINALTDNIRVAFLAALLFSIHPVHTESVAYISGRRDILSTLFYLLGFYFFIRYRSSSRLSYSALFLLCYLLALGSKEMAVTLPLLCFCYDMVGTLQITGIEKKAGSFKRIFRAIKGVVVKYRYFYLMFFIAASYFTYYKVWIKSPSQRHSFYGESILLHFLTVFKIIVHYLRLMFYPVNLTADYSYNGFPIASSLFDPAVLTAILILACILYGLWRLLITSPLMSLGVLWWFLALLPVCQIFPHHELMAEHYLYLPSVGLFLFIALVVIKGLETGKWRTITYSFLCVIVVLFSARTACRNRDWKDSVTLWEKTVKCVPRCLRAQNNLGVWYYNQGRYQKAKERHKLAIRLNPYCAESYNNLGNDYLAGGLYKEAEEQYKRALQLNPDFEKARYNLGIIYIKEGRNEEAYLQFREVLKTKPKFAHAYFGLGIIAILEKDSFYNFYQDIDMAAIMFRLAIKRNPGFAEAHSNLGNLYKIRGEYQKAEQELIKAIQLKPDLLKAYKSLAGLYEIMGRKEKAIETYTRLLALSPESGD